MAVKLSPLFNDAQVDGNGVPLSGGQVFWYLAGTTTPQTTYTDSTGSTAQANPIILNSRGEPANPIWLTTGVAYKAVLKDSIGNTIRTIDNISGVNDVAQAAVSEWATLAGSATFINATTFSVPGDQTAILQVNRRIKAVVTGGTFFGTALTSVFTTVTTVTVSADSISLDSGLASVQYGILAASGNSVPALFLPLASGGTVSGAVTFGSTVTLNADPTTALQATTKQYTDRVSTQKINRELVNVGLAVSLASNAATIALKGADGNDPSASNVVKIGFRSSTITSGTVNERSVTAALSTTISSGSTGGTVSATPSRIWIAAIDNAGTVELAWFNARSGTIIAPISDDLLISTTAEGGAGAADSAQTWYSTTARTNVPFTILGYFDSTQTTAGTWAQAITSLVVNPILRPGHIVQYVPLLTGTVSTGTTTIPADNTIPQNTEGTQFMSVTMSPLAAANVLRISSQLMLAHSGAGDIASQAALFQDAAANALVANWGRVDGVANDGIPLTLYYAMVATSTASTTFKVRAGGDSASTTTFNGTIGAQLYGGVANSTLVVEEIMA